MAVVGGIFFVVTKPWAMAIALAAVVLLLAVTHVLVSSAQLSTPEDIVQMRRRGVKALVIGADGRASTSKVQAVLWTLSVFCSFAFLLAWGRTIGCSQDGLSPEQTTSCEQATHDRAVFNEVGNELQSDYYVLLGFPLGVAVAARALTTNKVASGAITKPPIKDTKAHGVRQGLRETVSNDRGETDLLDFQYFAFNLIALAFFWVEFTTRPALGLPNLPATLVGLSGLSAAAYTTRKAVQVDVKPEVKAVIPHRIPLGSKDRTLSIIGTGFGDRKRGDPPDASGPPGTDVSSFRRALLDGVPLGITSWRPTRIDAVLSPDAFIAEHPEVGADPAAAEVVVDVPDGQPSDAFAVEVYRVPPEPSRANQ